MRTELISVVAAVISRNERLLICRRPDDKRHGGLWEFPGGKVEQGESFFEATSRELAEELGVKTLSVGEKLFSKHDPGSEFVIEFIPVEISGDPTCHEHTELAWALPAELASYDLAPSDLRFAQFLQAQNQNAPGH